MNPHENKEETYEGVPVQELLRRAGVPQKEKLRGSAMATYVLAEAADGYSVERQQKNILIWSCGPLLLHLS